VPRHCGLAVITGDTLYAIRFSRREKFVVCFGWLRLTVLQMEGYQSLLMITRTIESSNEDKVAVYVVRFLLEAHHADDVQRPVIN